MFMAGSAFRVATPASQPLWRFAFGHVIATAQGLDGLRPEQPMRVRDQPNANVGE